MTLLVTGIRCRCDRVLPFRVDPWLLEALQGAPPRQRVQTIQCRCGRIEPIFVADVLQARSERCGRQVA